MGRTQEPAASQQVDLDQLVHLQPECTIRQCHRCTTDRGGGCGASVRRRFARFVRALNFFATLCATAGCATSPVVHVAIDTPLWFV